MSSLLLSLALQASAQEDGSTGQTSQALVGDPVDDATEQRLGLVAVTRFGGSCSGTLINRYWVLTAAHCVTTDGKTAGPIAAPGAFMISADWTSRTAVPTQVVSYYPTIHELDVALLFLGEGDLGPTNTQPLFPGVVDTSQTIRQYGLGINQFATVDPPAQVVTDGEYRSGLFTPRLAGGGLFTMPVTAGGPSAVYGDSGGPGIVEYDGIELGIAGVASWGQPSGWVPGHEDDKAWVTGVTEFTDAAIYAIRADIVTRSQEVPGGQVWVSRSTGGSFEDAVKVVDGFCTRDEVCKVGDINADGFDDLVRFVKTDFSVRDSDVWVAFADGTGGFERPRYMLDAFCTLDEVCDVADVTGDGRADLVAFVRTNHGPGDSDVWVAESWGDGFYTPQKEMEYFCTLNEICKVGDVTGDGKADLVSFVRTNHGPGDSDVWVAESYGSGFYPAQKEMDYFCTGNETCDLADMDGDGTEDLVSFVRTNNGVGDSDVWVALSTGTGFQAGQKWSDYFCTQNQTCALGDVNADGRADGILFVKTDHGPADSDVWITLSWGNALGFGEKWHDYFCTLDETCAVGDVDGDGRDDVIAFVRGD